MPVTQKADFDLATWRHAHYTRCGVFPLLDEHEMHKVAMAATASKHTQVDDVCRAMDVVDFVRGHITLKPANVEAINKLMGRCVLACTQMAFTLPWPNRLLSPNVPGHWAAKARAKKAYRTACKRVVDEVDGLMPSMPPDGAVRVSMRFCPPDKRARDLDNLLASMKSGLDGVADALGVDDSVFRPAVDWGPVKPGGVVEIQLEVIK